LASSGQLRFYFTIEGDVYNIIGMTAHPK